METRPFNLEHAKAGAPVCINGLEVVKVLTFERNDHYPILTMAGNGHIGSFMNDGHGPLNARLLMAPINMLEGKPVFFGDTIERLCRGGWEPWIIDAAIWLPEARFRWPKPKRNIPKTSMNDAELVEAFNKNAYTTETGMRKVANLAIERAVGDGDVIPANEVDHMAAADAMRDESLAIIADERSNWAVQKEMFIALDAVHKRIRQIDAGKFSK